MPFDAHANLAYSTVASFPTPPSSGTSLTVQAGDGALFPAAPFNCTVWPVGTLPVRSNAEIVRVLSKSGDVFAIARAQEGTTARAIGNGDQIANSISAKVLTDIETNPTFSGDISEKGRTTPMGHWIDVPYNAANFTAAAGTWTVEAGDVVTYCYTLIGKTVICGFFISTSATSATTSTLYIQLPAGIVSARTIRNPIQLLVSGAWVTGFAYVSSGDSRIGLIKVDTSNFVADSNIYVIGEISFPIT